MAAKSGEPARLHVAVALRKTNRVASDVDLGGYPVELHADGEFSSQILDHVVSDNRVASNRVLRIVIAKQVDGISIGEFEPRRDFNQNSDNSVDVIADNLGASRGYQDNGPADGSLEINAFNFALYRYQAQYGIQPPLMVVIF